MLKTSRLLTAALNIVCISVVLYEGTVWVGKHIWQCRNADVISVNRLTAGKRKCMKDHLRLECMVFKTTLAIYPQLVMTDQADTVPVNVDPLSTKLINDDPVPVNVDPPSTKPINDDTVGTVPVNVDPPSTKPINDDPASTVVTVPFKIQDPLNVTPINDDPACTVVTEIQDPQNITPINDDPADTVVDDDPTDFTPINDHPAGTVSVNDD